MEWRYGDYLLSDDKTRLQIDVVHALLLDTYWGFDRSLALVAKSIENSFAMGLYLGDSQVGFCRAVTDYATFTWLCDVVIHPEHRARGLGKFMVETLIQHPSLQTRRQILATKDAHTLYQRHGFEPFDTLLRPTSSPC